MFYEPRIGHGLPHSPLKALVAPRPIGWISALDAGGRVNLSPYSFFNMVSERPPIVMFTSGGRKDAVAFVEETGEFVCNVVTFDLAHAMNETSAALPRGESEFVRAGLAMTPSRIVQAPRVAAAAAALECKLVSVSEIEDMNGVPSSNFMVLGQVVGVHIEDRFIVNGVVDTAALRLVGRGGYFDYTVADTIFQMPRPD